MVRPQKKSWKLWPPPEMQNNKQTIASLSIDLDDKWSYMKTHGDIGDNEYPSYLPTVVPRILQFLDQHNLKITFFIVGQDAAFEKNRDLLRAIVEAGHEIGNHSFKHEPWLHLYNRQQIADELGSAELSIEQATGVKPVGFRGPGYSFSCETLQELVQQKYRYDSSTFPTFVTPLARAYYFATASFSREEREKRAELGGSFKDGFRPIKPYLWNIEGGKALVEIPVSTLPFFRLPTHLTYIVALSVYSPKLAMTYFQAALKAFRLVGLQPSLLLHPPDFLGHDDAPELSFLPGMQMSFDDKIKVVGDVVSQYVKAFEVKAVLEQVNLLQQQRNLPLRDWDGGQTATKS